MHSDELLKDFPSIKTVYDMFQYGLKMKPNSPCFGHRPTERDPATGGIKSGDFVWQTYKQVSERRIDFGCGLEKLNKDILKGPQRFNVGIYSVYSL